MPKQSLEVAGLSAAPGKRTASVLNLTFDGTPIKMPLYLLNGANEGPTVVVTAGIHGAEYVGIESAFRLGQQTDPATLNGQLIVAPISSMNAFARRSIYLCPPDNKNLNRQFPGKADGTFAEQLAYWIFHNLISRANFYIDLHGGDMNEALVPFSIIRRTDNANIFNQSLALAQAFGLPNIVASIGNGQTNSAAASAGIPSVLAEVGGQGLWPEEQVQQMSAGLRRAIAHTGLIPKSGDAPPPSRMIEDMVWLRSSHDGLFYPSCVVGDNVQKGQQLGHIKDFVGNVVEEVISPATGVVLFLVTTLAMNDNDPLLAVGA